MSVVSYVSDPAERSALLEALSRRLDIRSVEKPDTAPGDDALVFWWHSLGSPEGEPVPDVLLEWTRRGGRVLLTGGAAALARSFTGEPVEPVVETEWQADDLGQLFGVMGLPGQAPFHRATGGVHLARAAAERPGTRISWPYRAWPQRGLVLGVSKRNDEPIGATPAASLVEFSVGQGRVLVLGAPLGFDGEPNLSTEPRERFIGDLVDYLVSDHAAERTTGWPRPAERVGGVRAVSGSSVPLVSMPETVTAEPLQPAEGTARVAVRQADCAILDPSGLRFEHGPFVAFDRLAWSGVAADGELRVGSSSAAWCRSDGEAFVRLAPGEDGGFSLVFRNLGDAALDVELTADVSLRLLEPYGGTESSVSCVTARHGAAAVFGDERLGLRARLIADRRPDRASLTTGTDGSVSVTRAFAIPAGDELTVSIAANAPEWWAPNLPPEPSAEGRLVVDGAESVTSRDALARHASQSGDLAASDLAVAARGWLPLGASDLVLHQLRRLASVQRSDGRIPGRVYRVGVPSLESPEDGTAWFIDTVARLAAFEPAGAEELWPAAVRALEWIGSTAESGAALQSPGVAAGAVRAAEWMQLLAARFGDEAVEQQARALAAVLLDRMVEGLWSADSELWIADSDVEAVTPWAWDVAGPSGTTPPLRAVRRAEDAMADPAFRLPSIVNYRVGRPDAVDAFEVSSAAGDAALSAQLCELVDGLAGWRVAADELRVVFEPTLPSHLRSVSFEDIQCGASCRVRGEVARSDDESELIVRLDFSEDLDDFELAPFVLGPATIEGVTHQGDESDFYSEEVGDGVRLRIRGPVTAGSHEWRFKALPELVFTTPSRGAYAARRVTVDGEVVMEFAGDQPAEIPIATPGRPVVHVEGGDWIPGDTNVLSLSASDGGTTVRIRFAGGDS